MDNKNEDKKKKLGYWYKFFYEECVLCGRSWETKWRVYDKPKPEDWYERHEFRQYVCGEHFL